MTSTEPRPADSTITLPITGMTCAACERRVGRALRALPGVEAVSVSAPRGRATVTGTPPPLEVLREAIRRAGYLPGSPPWLSRARSVWVSAGAGTVALVAAGWLLTRLGLTSFTPDAAAGGALLGLLVGLVAGVSTCMALVGGLVLGISAAATDPATTDPATTDPATTDPATTDPATTDPATTVQAAAGWWRRLRPQLVFTAGRITGFAVGGGLLGAIGSAARLPGPAVAAGTLLAAAVMTLLGVRLTGVSPRVSGWTPTLPRGWADRAGLRTDRGVLLAGAATFLLPCGFTQAMQVYAVSLGSPIGAAGTMAAFALGTTPGLLGLGTMGSLARDGRRSAVATRLVGVLLLGFAAVSGTGGLRALGLDLPSPTALIGGTAAEVVPTTVSPNVRLVGGAQVVTMTQSADGYSPAETVVWAGVPITWSIDITGGYTCTTSLRIPSVGVSVDLPTTGRHLVQVPALPVGRTAFHCAMGMYGGQLRAIPRPSPGTGASPSP